MYTQKALDQAAEIISRIARLNQVTEAQVRRDMKEAMDAARQNTDPTVRARWKAFSYVGTEPSLEEFILWMACQVHQ